MDILRRQYGTRRVLANSVYQEYIKDKDHYHMNATRVMTFDLMTFDLMTFDLHLVLAHTNKFMLLMLWWLDLYNYVSFLSSGRL